MTKKRFENRLDKSNVKFNTLNPVWDNEKEDALNVFEMIDELNRLNSDCSNLIDDNTEFNREINQMYKENEQLKKDCTALISHNQEYRKENEQLKSEIENLKITIDARDTLIKVCEKKFRELGFIITVNDDGYVIE